jgi:hypothetical protein
MRQTRRGLLMALPALALAPRAFADERRQVASDADQSGVLLQSWFDPRNRPTARVTLNGQGPFRFLVDTAATTTVIRDATAQALGLAPEGRVMVVGTTGGIELPVTRIPELETGVVRKRGVRAAVLPGSLDNGCDGILGADVFAGRRLVFDMRSRNVRVAPTLTTSTSGRARMRLRNGAVPELPGQVGSVPTRMIIDTGAECTIVNLPLSQALLQRQPSLSRIPDASIVGLTGEVIRGEGIFLPQVWVDDLKLRGVAGIAADAPVFRVWGLDRQPAMIVGADLLSLFGRISVDYGSGNFEIAGLMAAPDSPATYARREDRLG